MSRCCYNRCCCNRCCNNYNGCGNFGGYGCGGFGGCGFGGNNLWSLWPLLFFL
ncbi:hypothetical protein [Clostridium chromiireducens]|uniref:Uncharacterized protein n=1 Tax=Clostridium chromiireducens TaxID=225345 RepID=A0A1V4IDT0_9CLOT|nr:hypothetical protein [Clostridium chromiireducens]OPJ57687.1 hypothetical protein CLCHR_42910 [Clostridium chromiireducens]